MKKNYLFFMITAVSLSLFLSCTHLLKKEIDSTSDRTYYFTEFNYTHLGSSEDEVFKFMKNFPLKKVMYLIAREHNIKIDISDFQKFMLKGSHADIKVKKGFRKEFFSWNSLSKSSNRVIIRYKKDYFEQKNPEFYISLVIDGKTFDLMDTEVQDNAHIISRIAGYYKTAEKGIADYERLDYDKTAPVPGIIEYTSSAITGTESSDKDNTSGTDQKAEIKKLLQDYVQNLDNEEKAEFRHEMLDLIYKITE